MQQADLLLDRLLQQSKEFYSLPGVALRVLELTSQSTVEANRLKQCIENDPALTAKLLRVVNSSLFGLSRRVVDLNQAIALLGTKPLKLLVLGFSLPDNLMANIAGDVLDRYWQMSLTRAIVAREIANETRLTTGDEVFISGLLMDVGSLVLVQHLGEPYVQFLRRVAESTTSTPEMERQVLGFDSQHLTVRLLQQWGLPESIVDTIAQADELRLHGTTAQPPTRQSLVLHLATQIARMFVEKNDSLFPEIVKVAQQWHGLSAERLMTIVDSLQERVDQLAEVMLLKLPEHVNYHDLMHEAHRRLVKLAAEAAGDLIVSQGQAMVDRVDKMMLMDEVKSLAEAVESYRKTSKSAPRSNLSTAASGPALAPARSDNSRGETSGTTVNVGQGSRGNPTGRGTSFSPAPRRNDEPDFDESLLELLSSTASMCRQSRQGLSFLLVQLDHYEQLVFRRGLTDVERLLDDLERHCKQLDSDETSCFTLQEAQLGMILPGCERRRAVEIGNELLGTLRDSTPRVNGTSVTASIGLCSMGIPTRSFSPQQMLEAAKRCLFGATATGGNCLKSIEIY